LSEQIEERIDQITREVKVRIQSRSEIRLHERLKKGLARKVAAHWRSSEVRSFIEIKPPVIWGSAGKILFCQLVLIACLHCFVLLDYSN